MLALFLLYVFLFGYLVGVICSRLQELTFIALLESPYVVLLCTCFLFIFWLSLIVQFTSAFSLGCIDLCKVSTEDSNHVIS